eukprot:1929920-Rhodomonas_salina.2
MPPSLRMANTWALESTSRLPTSNAIAPIPGTKCAKIWPAGRSSCLISPCHVCFVPVHHDAGECHCFVSVRDAGQCQTR